MKYLFITFLALVFGSVGWYVYTEYRKSYWDRQVLGLCNSEGGFTSYENVEISLAENPGVRIRENGNIDIPDESTAPTNTRYVVRVTETEIAESNPLVRKLEALYLDKFENKILAKLVLFSRRGGDFPLVSFPGGTSFSCNDIPGHTLNVRNQLDRTIRVLEDNL